MFSSLLSACAAFIWFSSAHAQEVDYLDRIDRERLASGEIHLGLFLNGQRDGSFHLGWQLDGDDIHAFDRSMLASQEIYETMDVRLAANDLSPRSADIRFHAGLDIFEFDVDFEPNSVSNTITTTRPRGEDSTQTLSAPLPDGTLARVTAFILPAIMHLEVGESMRFDWYALLSHGVAQITLSAVERVEIETPVGPFTTTRIELRGGAPENDIFVDTESGDIVRIDVLGQDMSFLKLADD